MPKKAIWDIPTPEPQGDSSVVSLYHAVGVATSTFEILQTRLVELFCALVRSESVALARAFGTLESVPQKVHMARYAAEITLAKNPELLKPTADLLAEVENFSLRRNDIVHAMVSEVEIGGQNLGYYLCPGDHVAKKSYIEPVKGEWWAYRLTAAQVEKFAQEFSRVGDAVGALAGEIERTLKSSVPASRDIPESK